MRVSAKADYALRGLLEIASASEPPVKRDSIARAFGPPARVMAVPVRNPYDPRETDTVSSPATSPCQPPPDPRAGAWAARLVR